MFKTNVSEQNKIWGGTKKIWGTLSPNAPRVCGPGQNHRQNVFRWGLHVCAGG